MYTNEKLTHTDFATLVVDETTSTMDLAREVVRNEAPSDSIWVVAARRQTRGRGRGGSEWLQASPPEERGDGASRQRVTSFREAFQGENDVLPFTLIVPPQRVRIPFEWITLAVGCAIVDALRGSLRFLEQVAVGEISPGELTAESIRLKWPNDVLIHRDGDSTRKLCGVLCESSFRGNQLGEVFVGMGINFFEAPDLDIAMSLWKAFLENMAPGDARRYRRFFSEAASRDAVLRDFCARLESELLDYLETPRAVGQLRALAMERSLPLGTQLSVNKGEFRGGFAGIDGSARLLLSGVPEPVVAGDVTIEKPPVLRRRVDDEPLPGELLRPRPAPVRDPAAETQREGFVPLQVAHRGVPQGGGPRALHVALDLGNTRLHWGLENEGSFLTGDLSYEILGQVKEVELRKSLRPLLSLLRGVETLRCPYASVASRDETRGRIAFLRDFFLRNLPSLKFEPIEISSPEVLSAAGLEGQYTQTLGVDRALRLFFAARESRASSQPVLVCGAGTAVTFEGVAGGRIVESGILPGFRMMFESLHQGTAQLPRVQWPPASPSEGSTLESLGDLWNTEITVRQGVCSAISGAVSSAAERCHARRVVISGGDAEPLGEIMRSWAEEAGVALEVRRGLELQALLEFSQILSARPFDVGLTPVREVAKDAPAPEARPSDAAEESLPEALDEEESEEFGHLSHKAAAAVVRSMWRARKRRLAPPGAERTSEHFRKLGPRVESDAVDVRIDRHLAERYRFHTRDEWRKRILDGDVLIENRASRLPRETPPEGVVSVKHTYRMKLHDQIWFYHPLDHEPDCMADVEVLGDDGDIVVFSKPGNLVIHAVGQYSRNTFLAIAEGMGYGNAAPVHRIDRETSGILLCARSLESRRAVCDAFRHGQMEKMYLAVCKPLQPLPRVFRVVAPIGEAVGSQIRLKLWIGGPGAQDAETHFLLLSEHEGYALVACYPQTGRTNQIRIHLAAAGAWIVGDKMYHAREEVFLEFYESGLTEQVLAAVEFPRHMLHNAAIQGHDQLPAIISQGPAVCHVPADMMSFGPLQVLLEKAGIPAEREGHDAALRALFRKPRELDFEALPPLELAYVNGLPSEV